MEKFTLQCPYCGQFGFPSHSALTQHTQRSVPCKEAMLTSVGVRQEPDIGYTTASEFLPVDNIRAGRAAPMARVGINPDR